jgi:hypothetical protein
MCGDPKYSAQTNSATWHRTTSSIYLTVCSSGFLTSPKTKSYTYTDRENRRHVSRKSMDLDWRKWGSYHLRYLRGVLGLLTGKEAIAGLRVVRNHREWWCGHLDAILALKQAGVSGSSVDQGESWLLAAAGTWCMPEHHREYRDEALRGGGRHVPGLPNPKLGGQTNLIPRCDCWSNFARTPETPYIRG